MSINSKDKTIDYFKERCCCCNRVKLGSVNRKINVKFLCNRCMKFREDIAKQIFEDFESCENGKDYFNRVKKKWVRE